MKYAVKMGSGSVVYIPSFIKIGSGIQKLMRGGGDSQTYRQHDDLISLLLFLRNKESRLKQSRSFILFSLICFYFERFLCFFYKISSLLAV
jgi:hypothetical protein